MPEEWWTTPGEAERRLAQLTDQWANVRNAALGRGVQPLVSSELADHVASEHEAFMKWRETIGGFELVTSWADDLTEWTARANKVGALVRAELSAKGLGGRVPAPLAEFTAVGPAVLLQGMQGLAFAAIALWLWSRRK